MINWLYGWLNDECLLPSPRSFCSLILNRPLLLEIWMWKSGYGRVRRNLLQGKLVSSA